MDNLTNICNTIGLRFARVRAIDVVNDKVFNLCVLVFSVVDVCGVEMNYVHCIGIVSCGIVWDGIVWCISAVESCGMVNRKGESCTE